MNVYTFHITLYDLLFVGAIFIGLTFALQLSFTKRINQTANRLLGLGLVIIVLQIVWVLGNDIRLGVYFPRWSWLPLQFSLAIGPLIYFYVLKTTRPEFKFRWKDMLHFGPLLLQQGTLVLEIKESIRTGVATYHTLIFKQLNSVLHVLAVISVITYLYLSRRLIRNFHWRLNANSIGRPKYQLRWLRRLLKRFALFWLLWIPFMAADYFYYHNQLGIHVYYPIYLLLVVMMIWIAAAAFLRQDMGMPILASPVLRPSPRGELRQKGKWLRKVMEGGVFYQNPDLSLNLLADTLDIHHHELSRIINVAIGKNFNDFINEYRIREVTRKMQDPAYDRLTLLGIALGSGFSSKTTFNRVFREITGKSPVEYKNYLKKERPSYHLEPYLEPYPYSIAVISYHEATPVWSHEKLNRNYMFKNYLKIAWRNLMRNKSYAAINVTGLAIGIASCLLIFLAIHYETSFDNFHQNKDRIYRVVTAAKTPEGMQYGTGVPLPTSEGLRLDYPQIQVTSIFRNSGQISVLDDDARVVKKFKESDIFFSDPQFFGIFNFGWLSGDKKNALTEPNTVVLTQETAEKYFGNWRDALGKTIVYENKNTLKVTGILQNMPANTDLHLSTVISFATLNNTFFKSNLKNWVSTFKSHYCFALLPANISVVTFNNDLAAFVKKHKPAEYVKDGMVAQPLKEMHFDDRLGVFEGNTFSMELIKALSLIGIFLLIIACVNFINLATAQSINRSKEVGIRKVLGSNRNQLIFQFIGETFIITVCAVAFAIGIAEIALPYLNHLLTTKLDTAILTDPLVWVFLVAVVLAVTFLSGFYPAIVLSGFNPVTALKNKIAAGNAGGISLRRGLVVVQFFIAQLLVIVTIVFISQMSYFSNKSLGFDKDAIITIPVPEDSIAHTKLIALHDQLLQRSGIKDVSFSFTSPSDNSNWGSNFRYNNSPKKTDFEANLKWADAEYFKLYNLKFVAGGPYAKSDTISQYVVNETLIKKLGLHSPKEAIGKFISLQDDKKTTARIIGVVKDFNVASLKEPIPAVVMSSWRDAYETINIKLQGNNIQQSLASIQKLWSTTFPNAVYEYQFLDDKIAKFYDQETQLSALYKIFAGIAIFISCLGLYGLVSFMAVQRAREVGIRKTLGASVGHILYLFSKEFTLLIIVAFGISAPVGYYFMQRWLQNFTYKISIGPVIFVLAIVVSVAIAWVTVGYKAIRAALANPVNSLRSE